MDAVDLLVRTASGDERRVRCTGGGCSPTPVSSSAPSWPCRTSRRPGHQDRAGRARGTGPVRGTDAGAGPRLAHRRHRRRPPHRRLRGGPRPHRGRRRLPAADEDGTRRRAPRRDGQRGHRGRLLPRAGPRHRAGAAADRAGRRAAAVRRRRAVPPPTPTVACSRARARSRCVAAGPGRRRPSVGVLGVVWQRRVEALPGPLASMVQTLAGEAAHTLARTALLEQLVVAVERATPHRRRQPPPLRPCRRPRGGRRRAHGCPADVRPRRPRPLQALQRRLRPPHRRRPAARLRTGRGRAAAAG